MTDSAPAARGIPLNEQLRTRVAWLYYMENMTQAEIAKRLHLTRARVNRTLGECRETGLVRITLNSRLESCLALENRLRQRGVLRDALIIPTPEDPDQLFGLLGMAAGEYLSRFIATGHLSNIGIGWGTTLRETIRHVQPARHPGLCVTSMMGGLRQGFELNTFEIAGEFARRLQAHCRYLAAPIYAASRRSRDTILAQEVFQEVLERWSTLELALLSMGDMTSRSLLIRYGLPRDVALGDLKANGAVGDVLGQFLDARGKPISHRINSRAIALPLDRLAKVGTVALIAGGSNKTQIVAAALRGGVGHVLISDEKTVAAALRLIEQDS